MIKQLRITEDLNYKRWMPKEHEETEYELVVCEPTTVAEIAKIIKSHKSDQAPGVDGVQSETLKHTSASFVQAFTNVINEVLESCEVLSILLTGKITSIDKKKPKLLVSKKWPLIVPTLFLSLLTNLIHKGKDPIFEEKGCYCSVQ